MGVSVSVRVRLRLGLRLGSRHLHMNFLPELFLHMATAAMVAASVCV